tara:strand:+ start:38 stop:403 length:366 start_codon:yes stop_codon:yes gene_type:complete
MSEENDDYLEFLNEIGLTVKQMSDAAAVSTWKDCDSETVQVGCSEIHGQGVRAKVDLAPSESIPAIHQGQWTQWGRFMNHSKYPNVKPVGNIQNIALVPLQEIGKGSEVLVNYRDMLACLK